MSGKKEESDVQKQRRLSKAVSDKGDVNDRNKVKKNEKRNASELRDEATSSRHVSSHKSSRNHSNAQTNRNPPKKNIAQNRLKKLRTKLDAEINLKDKIETVGISRLLDESVVKVEKSRNVPNRQRSPKIPRGDNRGNSYTRNIASDRLKKVKKEVQATITTIERNQSSTPSLELAVERDSVLKPVVERDSTLKPAVEREFALRPAVEGDFGLKPAVERDSDLKPAEERDSFMEIDEDISETDEKLSNPSLSLLKNNNTAFGDITSKIPAQYFEKESFNRNPNVSNDDSHYDVVPFINDEIYKIRNEPSYMALHTNFLLDIGMEVDTPAGDLLIVVDTNVLLSHLNIVNYILTNASAPSLGSCVLVVPWLVIQEIDYAMKKNNERLNNQARFANNFINDCLKKKNPRFFAQSLIDFKDNFKNAVHVDDFILQYCMKFVSFDKKVILLTNDKNLCNKAMINNLSVFTAKEFVNSFDLSGFF